MAPARPIAVALVLAVAAAGLLAGCGEDSGDGRPSVVVTTPVLGAVVGELTGDAAEVRVLMPDGADPHDHRPSARDVGRLLDADLVVENGLGLEEGLGRAIERARDDGVTVFTAADHVRLRAADGHRHGEDEGEGEEDHDHGAADPHIWMDPIAMRDVAAALAPVLEDELGVDLGGRAGATTARLERLDAQVRATLDGVPAERRRLVTGHDSMGYFADRYGIEVVGAIVPAFSSQSQPSGGDLAALRAQVEALRVPAILDETGTPPGVARAVAEGTGARVIAIRTHDMPDDGSYATFIRGVADAVRDGLAP